MTVRFRLNGQPRSIEPAPGESLLDALRERCGIVSIKDGCQPRGQCSACLALVDGRPLMTCAFEAARAEDRQVLTLEGLTAAEREVVSKAFAEAGGVQCGFCIPGIALRAKHLLERQQSPSRDEIARAIDGHLCRCTGYTQIVDAVELMARAWRGGAIAEPAVDGGVGRPLARYQAFDLALGVRPYVASSYSLSIPDIDTLNIDTLIKITAPEVANRLKEPSRTIYLKWPFCTAATLY